MIGLWIFEFIELVRIEIITKRLRFAERLPRINNFLLSYDCPCHPFPDPIVNGFDIADARDDPPLLPLLLLLFPLFLFLAFLFLPLLLRLVDLSS